MGHRPTPAQDVQPVTGRLGIDDVSPSVGEGRYPSKAVVGEVVPIAATVWREGHDAVAAEVVWQKAGAAAVQRIRMAPHATEPDRFVAAVVPDEAGLWTFRVDACSDPWSTWHHAVTVKLGVGQSAEELANDLEVGAQLLDQASSLSGDGAARDLTGEAAAALRDHSLPVARRVEPAFAARVDQIMVEHPVRELITHDREYQVYVDRREALFASWYEFFPRSTGGWDESGRPVHGTFVTAAKELDRIAAMKFDVVYLPPIHPIGTVNRKGATRRATRADSGRGPRRGRFTLGHGLVGRRARHDPSRAGDLRRRRRVRHPRATSAWRSRSTSRCRPLLTTPGCGRIWNGSPPVRTAPSPTRRIRQEVPRHVPAQLRQRSRGHLPRSPTGA
jgi:alpha-1,4-glucan:maltose-1-phosphate maltosyltransferase-like protein